MVNRNIDSFGHDEMATPELKLVQNTGGDDAKSAGAHPGDFYFPLTGEIIGGATGLDVIIADVIKTRTYWGRDDIGEDPPQCASVNDRYHKSMDGQDCLKCEKRADMPGMMDKAERRSKCLAGYNILAIRSDESRAPMLIRVSGISVKHFRALNTALHLNKTLLDKQGVPQYEKVAIHVAPVKEKSSSGEAFAFTFKVGKLLPTDLAAVFLSDTERLLGGIPELPPAEDNEPTASGVAASGSGAGVVTPPPALPNVDLKF